MAPAYSVSDAGNGQPGQPFSSPLGYGLTIVSGMRSWSPLRWRTRLARWANGQNRPTRRVTFRFLPLYFPHDFIGQKEGGQEGNQNTNVQSIPVLLGLERPIGGDLPMPRLSAAGEVIGDCRRCGSHRCHDVSFYSIQSCLSRHEVWKSALGACEVILTLRHCACVEMMSFTMFQRGWEGVALGGRDYLGMYP